MVNADGTEFDLLIGSNSLLLLELQLLFDDVFQACDELVDVSKNQQHPLRVIHLRPIHLTIMKLLLSLFPLFATMFVDLLKLTTLTEGR